MMNKIVKLLGLDSKNKYEIECAYLDQFGDTKYATKVFENKNTAQEYLNGSVKYGVVVEGTLFPPGRLLQIKSKKLDDVRAA